MTVNVPVRPPLMELWNSIPDIIRDTPRTPTSLRRNFMTVLRSIMFLAVLLPVLSSDVRTLSILTDLSSLGSRRDIFA